MSIPTIQNVFHCKIESSFSIQHQKQLLSELVLLEGFITFMNFQFKPSLIDIIHHTCISSERKTEAKRKSINFSFNFIFIVEQTLSEKCPGTHYLKDKVPLDPTIFIIFLWEILSQTSKCPRTPLFFIIFVGKYCPRPHYIRLRLPRTPLYFIFSR